MILVYTLIFSQIMQAKLPGADEIYGYSIYLCAGILTWALFSEIANRCQNVFLENAGMIKKISFPKICLPIMVVLNACINFCVIFGLFTAFLIVSGNFPGWVYFLLPILLAIHIIFSVGLGMTLGVLNVFFRDVGQLFNVVLQFWFWLTPIVYPITILPEKFHGWMALNPMVGLMASYQTILVSGGVPDWSGLLPIVVLSVLFCISGVYLFKKHSGDMVDEL
jgi:lipopolysaccharide transport system permease protein